jgi:uncharacterized protein (TIGR03435 family)
LRRKGIRIANELLNINPRTGPRKRQESHEGESVKWYCVWLFVAATMPAYPQARFEVASVRPSTPGATAQDSRFIFRGLRLEAKAHTVGDILDMLGGWQLYRVTGGPAWMRTERFDITAKADRELITDGDKLSAVMALLAERFHLESHKETRQVPGIVVRAPKSAGTVKTAGSGEKYSIHMDDRGDVSFTAVPMSSLTNYLSQMWKVPVVDETELKGAYDFVLPTSRAEVEPGAKWGDQVREAAMELGFRVENRQIPLEITVVDRCERPSAN